MFNSVKALVADIFTSICTWRISNTFISSFLISKILIISEFQDSIQSLRLHHLMKVLVETVYFH
jgi:hypothetical protein